MAHADNPHNASPVVNFVDNAIVANPKAPSGPSYKLRGTTGTRRVGKGSNRGYQRKKRFAPIEPLEVTLCGGLDYEIVSHPRSRSIS